MKYLVTSDKIPYFNVKQRLRVLGASAYVLTKPELGTLASLLHEDESIEAFVYGVYSGGWGMLVATDRELIFIDKVFFNLKVDELPYSTISAVDHSFGHVFAKVTVHARSGDYLFRRINRKCAAKFVDYIEKRTKQPQDNLLAGVTEAQNLNPRLNYSKNFQIPPTYKYYL